MGMNRTGGTLLAPRSLSSRLVHGALVALVLAASLVVGTPEAGALRSPNGPDSLSVYRLYRAAFLREPDPAGLTYWYQAQLDGLSLTSIAEHFVGSPEFVARYGHLDDLGFVDQMYRNVFGRQGDLAGGMHWVRRLEEGAATRGGVLLGFADSVEHKASVLASAAGPVDPDAYSFLGFGSDGLPARWDPCSPVDVVANLDDAPAFAESMLAIALLRMSDATGAEWRLLGTTDERYDPDEPGRALVDVERYGDRWSPLLIQWDPDLGADVAPEIVPHGLHASGWVGTSSGQAAIVTGVVVLGRRSSETPRELVGYLSHLLANVYGLGPSAVPGNVMHREWTAAGWGTGDLEGFRKLRAGGCVDVPIP
jgi:hypothetical protein